MGIWEEGLAVVLTQHIHSYNYLSEDSSSNCHVLPVAVPKGQLKRREVSAAVWPLVRQKPHHFS